MPEEMKIFCLLMKMIIINNKKGAVYYAGF
jgi:hypothetical protein